MRGVHFGLKVVASAPLRQRVNNSSLFSLSPRHVFSCRSVFLAAHRARIVRWYSAAARAVRLGAGERIGPGAKSGA